mmetsp:Transcript_15199/g.42240  ORF Transcript_15199/g.42240 Transcript_15199/m.42240 type:complete len:244 (+) Transcript_15199:245-976(+)
MQGSVRILVAHHHQGRNVNACRIAIVELVQVFPLGLDRVRQQRGVGKVRCRLGRNGTLDGEIFDGRIEGVVSGRDLGWVSQKQRIPGVAYHRIVDGPVQNQPRKEGLVALGRELGHHGSLRPSHEGDLFRRLAAVAFCEPIQDRFDVLHAPIGFYPTAGVRGGSAKAPKVHGVHPDVFVVQGFHQAAALASLSRVAGSSVQVIDGDARPGPSVEHQEDVVFGGGLQGLPSDSVDGQRMPVFPR